MMKNVEALLKLIRAEAFRRVSVASFIISCSEKFKIAVHACALLAFYECLRVCFQIFNVEFLRAKLDNLFFLKLKININLIGFFVKLINL